VGKRSLFVYIYRRYLINAMLLYIEYPHKPYTARN